MTFQNTKEMREIKYFCHVCGRYFIRKSTKEYVYMAMTCSDCRVRLRRKRARDYKLRKVDNLY